MKTPPYPGDFMAEIVEPAGLSITAAAAALRVSRPALSSLLNGHADLSGDMALRMQASYDIARTRKREKQIRVQRIHQPAEIHP
jgi:addiction module HigA family antidote